MSRINNKDVKIGESYVLPLTNSTLTKYESKVESILNEVEEEKQVLLKKAEQEAQNIINNANQSVQDAEQQAQIIIQNAKDEGARIIKEAEQEQEQIKQTTEEIRKSAYDEGFEQGQKDGLEKFKTDAVESVKSLDAVVQTACETKNSIIKSAESDIVDLVIAITRKISSHSFDKDMLKEITLNAISQLKEKDEISIIISPKLITNIMELSEDFKNEILQLKNINIIEDSSLSSDGAIVQSVSSRVDARISAQIDEIASRLINGVDEDVQQG